MTDELLAYRGLNSDFEGGHKRIRHRDGVYVRYEDCGPVYVTTNNVESYFAKLKRAHHGTHHQMSHKHLHRYVTESEFKWNTRQVSDGERLVAAIEGADGKRLMYRNPA